MSAIPFMQLAIVKENTPIQPRWQPFWMRSVWLQWTCARHTLKVNGVVGVAHHHLMHSHENVTTCDLGPPFAHLLSISLYLPQQLGRLFVINYKSTTLPDTQPMLIVRPTRLFFGTCVPSLYEEIHCQTLPPPYLSIFPLPNIRYRGLHVQGCKSNIIINFNDIKKNQEHASLYKATYRLNIMAFYILNILWIQEPYLGIICNKDISF